MTDDIRAMSATLAEDPESLVFLDLGESLRRRGQLESALKVAMAGAARHPDLADARDLCARIHSDLGDGESAFDAWLDALQLDAAHLGAHKGLGFLYYRAGDLPRALRHLEVAAASAPEAGLDVAIARVRAALAAEPTPAAAGDAAGPDANQAYSAPVPVARAAALEGDPDVFTGFEAARDGLLLLDANGLRLGGGIRNRAGADVSDAVAAHLAGVSREASRAARLLALGTWRSLSVESPDGTLHLTAPTDATVLLTVRDASVPAGRLVILAERAAEAARRWLERLA
jgi:predicted regulator of Ras-like GTPase activity (Roadblock/LC7/MglB family)